MLKDFADYAAEWGCDPCYDHAPRKSGDGYLFYNFGVEGNDRAFLLKFIPAIRRTIKSVKANLNDHEPQDIGDLGELLTECQGRLGYGPLGRLAP
jgi:hypothetical protein